MKNKKTLVALFAHPDDEAFGPGGTLALYTKTHDVYIICATKGESGENHSKDLSHQISEIRSGELLASAAVLGVKEVFFLDQLDGSLCNNFYHQIAEKAQTIIQQLKPEILLTYEPRGVSGHIDHVIMSMITNYLFDRSDSVQTLLMYCVDDKYRQEVKDYFIFFPPGYKHNEIDKIVDVTAVWSKKLEAMNKHSSQQQDIDRLLLRYAKLPREEYFLVRKK